MQSNWQGLRPAGEEAFQKQGLGARDLGIGPGHRNLRQLVEPRTDAIGLSWHLFALDTRSGRCIATAHGTLKSGLPFCYASAVLHVPQQDRETADVDPVLGRSANRKTAPQFKLLMPCVGAPMLLHSLSVPRSLNSPICASRSQLRPWGPPSPRRRTPVLVY